MSRKIWAFVCAVFTLTIGTAAFAEAIRIESGTYGTNCGAREGNLTRDLAAHCDSLDTCRYVLRANAHQTFLKGCPADLTVRWSCGPKEFHTATVRGDTGRGSSLELTCAPSTGAGK